MSSEWASTDSLAVRAAPGFVMVSPKSAPRTPSGTKVGALHPEACGIRQVISRVAPPAGELRRRTDPLPVEAEPHTVDELQRWRPHAAHLARDVPAVGVETAVLEADGIRPRPRRNLAAAQIASLRVAYA